MHAFDLARKSITLDMRPEPNGKPDDVIELFKFFVTQRRRLSQR